MHHDVSPLVPNLILFASKHGCKRTRDWGSGLPSAQRDMAPTLIEYDNIVWRQCYKGNSVLLTTDLVLTFTARIFSFCAK